MSEKCRGLTEIAVSYLDMASQATYDLSTYCRGFFSILSTKKLADRIKRTTFLCDSAAKAPSDHLMVEYLKSASFELRHVHQLALNNFVKLKRKESNMSVLVLSEAIVDHIKSAYDTVNEAMSSLTTS